MIEKTIHQMMTENTGVALGDSGGDHGRHWQKNQGLTLEDLRARPAIEVDGSEYVIDVFHFLAQGKLTTDALCDEFNSRFVPAKDHFGGAYGVSTEGVEFLTEQAGLKQGRSFNGYNHGTKLSQVLQYTEFDRDSDPNTKEPHYVALQIHNGADVRGGYTDARLFLVEDFTWCLEDVAGSLVRDGETTDIGNGYDGENLTDMDGNRYEPKPGDELFLEVV